MDEGAASRNANDVLMLRAQLKSLGERSVIVNKAVLETEKSRDELHNQIEQIEQRLKPKRALTDDDAGDTHDLLAEFDNCDLSDHRREGTRVQNRCNVKVGSRDNQQKPHTGKCGFFHHTRLGLVGWISSAGIRNCEKRVADIVVRELKRAKPGAWDCIQAREVWSTEEEANMWSGHFWICKFGTVPGSMT